MAKSPRRKIKDKLSKLTKELVRERDGYTCQKCNKFLVGRNCHVSHVKSVGAYPDMEFDLLNMKVLCFRHHILWWHKEPLEAGEWFKNKFPKRYKYLEKEKNNIKSRSVKDLEELYEKLHENQNS